MIRRAGQATIGGPPGREGRTAALVNYANALAEATKDTELDERAASAVALLALVAGQDVGAGRGSGGTDGRWRIVRKVAGEKGGLHRGPRCPAHP